MSESSCSSEDDHTLSYVSEEEEDDPFRIAIEEPNWKEQIQRMVEHLLNHQYYKGHLKKIRVEEFLNLNEKIRKVGYEGEIDYEKQAQVFRRFQQETLKRLESVTKRSEGAEVLKAIGIELERLKTAHPIYAKKYEILELLRKEQIITVFGATSSGKSTQIIQYLLGMEEFDKKIAIGEPARHLVEHIAKKIKEELRNMECEEEIAVLDGHSNHLIADKNIKLEFHTHKSLIQALIDDHMLSNYSCVIIDEAHERLIESDILISLLKSTLQKRKDLKLVITSATANQAIFDKLFEEKVPRIDISGKIWTLNVKYEGSFADHLVKTEHKIHDLIADGLEEERDEIKGDVLIFVAGRREVESLIDVLTPTFKDYYEILPFHGGLNRQKKDKIFKVSSRKKLIVSTRYAETGLTIPNLTVVIDCGFDLNRTYIRETHVTEEEVGKISRSSADQRAGRTARTCNGVCYRLYSEEEYNELEKYDKSAMKRYHYYNAIAMLKGMKIKDILSFEFLEELNEDDKKDMKNDLRFLQLMEILDENEDLLPFGAVMNESSLNPIQARILYEAMRLDCVQPVINILGLYSQDWTLFGRGTEANAIKRRFHSEDGTFMMFYKIYEEYEKEEDKNSWLSESGIDSRSFERACGFMKGAQEAIDKVLREKIIEIQGVQGSSKMTLTDRILRCFLAGYWFNFCERRERAFKLTRLGQYISIRPSLKDKERIDYIICDSVGKRSGSLHTEIYSRINGEWLNELSPGCLLELGVNPSSLKKTLFKSQHTFSNKGKEKTFHHEPLRNQNSNSSQSDSQRNREPWLLRNQNSNLPSFSRQSGKWDSIFSRGDTYKPKGFVNSKHQ